MGKKGRPSPTDKDYEQISRYMDDNYPVDIDDYDQFEGAWGEYFNDSPEMVNKGKAIRGTFKHFVKRRKGTPQAVKNPSIRESVKIRGKKQDKYRDVLTGRFFKSPGTENA